MVNTTICMHSFRRKMAYATEGILALAMKRFQRKPHNFLTSGFLLSTWQYFRTNRCSRGEMWPKLTDTHAQTDRPNYCNPSVHVPEHAHQGLITVQNWYMYSPTIWCLDFAWPKMHTSVEWEFTFCVVSNNDGITIIRENWHNSFDKVRFCMVRKDISMLAINVVLLKFPILWPMWDNKPA